MVAEDPDAVLGGKIRGAGHFRVHEGQIPVPGGVVESAAELFQVLGQGFNQQLVGVLPAALA